jgi:selenocysteine lyase/cysteine desulfurase
MQQMTQVNQQLLDTVRSRLQVTQQERDAAFSAFIERYPAYRHTQTLDALREREYSRLDALGHVYMDYTGGGLYAESQLREHMQLLASGVYGNPHSMNPTSLAMTELDERSRHFVLEYFNADPDEYLLIFTANASGALKLVGESYPFEKDGQYLLTFDNHNSVNGIREFARAKGAPVTYSPLMPDTLRIDEELLHSNLSRAIPGGNNLFAYPAQSNFSGVQHALEWIEIAHQHGWDVLLDAAAFAPTNRLDLSIWKPDFVSLSFYKIFGYPTGIGALIARRDTVRKLHRPWFAGGTIKVASVKGQGFYMQENEAGFEDGTINYLNIPAVEIGLRHMLQTGIDTVHERVITLTQYLLDEMSQLHHDNGAPLLRIYGPTSTEMRGGTISFNVYDPNGVIFDFRVVEGVANDVSISLRTGCFCNPGVGETAHGIAAERMRECFQSDNSITFLQLMTALTRSGDAQAVGAVRISIGLVTNFDDAYRLLRFFSAFLNTHSQGLLPE